MSNITNYQGITDIRFTKELRLYCPMGKDMYTAHVHVQFSPDKEIMDYCETNRFLDEMNQGAFIIEDAIKVIYDHIENSIHPLTLEVSITAESAAHMPVMVTKTKPAVFDCCSSCDTQEEQTHA